jgi:hypothetical protein
MSNKVSSYPTSSQPAPLHRFAGIIGSTPELSFTAVGDTYFIEGSGNVLAMPAWPKGAPIFVHMLNSPTFVNSARLLMPAGVNCSFSPGDSAWLLPLGNGVWRAIQICKADGSLWSNTRAAVTGTGSLTNSSKGKVVALGGNAFYTYTAPVATGFDSDFMVEIINEDSTVSGGFHTGRGKDIAIDGYPTFRLWPGQSFVLRVQNGVWRFKHPGRWICQGQPTINVTTNGNDTTGDGLATGTGGLATVQQALWFYEHYVDCNGFGPTIKLGAGTRTENNVSHTHPIIGYHVIGITGDTTTPSNCIWQVSGSGNTGLQCRDGGMAIITGVKFVSTGTGNFFLNAGQEGVLDYGSIEFGSNPSGYHLNQSPGGSMNWFGGSVTCSGNMNGFFLGSGEGHHLMDGATISIPSALTFFLWIQMNALSFLGATSTTYTGAGAGAGSTGTRWAASANAVISAGSVIFPGNATGSATTGGQFI